MVGTQKGIQSRLARDESSETMTNPNDPAFPPDLTGIPEGSIFDYLASQKGLTKREYFAAMAMQGITAYHEAVLRTETSTQLASRAIALADALIVELNK